MNHCREKNLFGFNFPPPIKMITAPIYRSHHLHNTGKSQSVQCGSCAAHFGMNKIH